LVKERLPGVNIYVGGKHETGSGPRSRRNRHEDGGSVLTLERQAIRCGAGPAGPGASLRCGTFAAHAIARVIYTGTNRFHNVCTVSQSHQAKPRTCQHIGWSPRSTRACGAGVLSGCSKPAGDSTPWKHVEARGRGSTRGSLGTSPGKQGGPAGWSNAAKKTSPERQVRQAVGTPRKPADRLDPWRRGGRRPLRGNWEQIERPRLAELKGRGKRQRSRFPEALACGLRRRRPPACPRLWERTSPIDAPEDDVLRALGGRASTSIRDTNGLRPDEDRLERAVWSPSGRSRVPMSSLPLHRAGRPDRPIGIRRAVEGGSETDTTIARVAQPRKGLRPVCRRNELSPPAMVGKLRRRQPAS